MDKLVIQLAYLELVTGKVTELRHSFSLAELSDFFAATTAIYLDWLRERHQWSQEAKVDGPVCVQPYRLQ